MKFRMYSKVSNSNERNKKFVSSCGSCHTVSSPSGSTINVRFDARIAFHVTLFPKLDLSLIGKLINRLAGLETLLFRALVYLAKLVLLLWIGGGHA